MVNPGQLATSDVLLLSLFQNLFYLFNLTRLCLDWGRLYKTFCIMRLQSCVRVCISQVLPVKSGN